MLAFILAVPSTVFAAGGDDTGGLSNVGATGAGMTFPQIAYRIRLVEEPNWDSGNCNTVTLDSTNKTMTVKPNNTSGIEDSTGSDYYYFTDVLVGALSYSVPTGTYKVLNNDGTRSDVTVHSKADLEAVIGTFADHDELINAGGKLDAYCNEDMSQWKEFFDYESSEKCVLVCETLYYVADTSTYDYTLISR